MISYINCGIIILFILGYILMYNNLNRLSIKVDESSSGIDVALEKRYDLLNEEIESVKKFLQHESEIYLSVTSIRMGKELEENKFNEKRALSQESLKTIDETIKTQQKQMEQIKKQIERQQISKSHRRKGDLKREEYQRSVLENRMNINQKIDMLSSIQHDIGGVEKAIDALAEQYPILYSVETMNYFQKTIFDAEEHLQAAKRLFNSNVSLYNQKIVMFPYNIVANLHKMEKIDFYQIDDKKKEYKVNF